jgi:hypothetical protein
MKATVALKVPIAAGARGRRGAGAVRLERETAGLRRVLDGARTRAAPAAAIATAAAAARPTHIAAA